jgi:uncharacterized membrane protein YgdD (TMEM256/DUF423 family)
MKMLVRLAAISGALAVIAGAFGAHGANGKAAEWLKIGAEYEMIHAIAALVAIRMFRSPLAGALMLTGSLVFAGTLYAMALGAPHWLGAVTPLGGLGMIAGWVVLAVRL